MNIIQILEDLRYVVQSDMDEQALQIQRMLAEELDQYKEIDVIVRECGQTLD